MGGADLDNVTLKVINALIMLNDPDIEVKIVVDPNNSHIDTLKNVLHNAPPALLNRGPCGVFNRGALFAFLRMRQICLN